MQETKERSRLWFKQGFFAIMAMVLVSICLVPNPAYSLPAFPGAEGFGSNTIGGRGGKVIEVTNLNDSGTGSLRACVTASGPRVCVFKTGGTIPLSSTINISNPYITIAGQTAPGGGITLKNATYDGPPLSISTHDVVLRYITSRAQPVGSNGSNTYALSMHKSNGGGYNIVIDHCSLSWGIDSVTETWYSYYNVTYSRNIIAEGLDCSTHSKGCHSKGLMIGGYAAGSGDTSGRGSYDISIHHNLLAHNGERAPMIKTSGMVDVVNNITYDVWWTFMHVYKHSLYGPMNYNFVNNYLKSKPGTSNSSFSVADDGVSGELSPSIYYNGNVGGTGVKSSATPYLVNNHFSVAMPVTTLPASESYSNVLADVGNNKRLDCSGNWVNKQDAHDVRVINDVKNGTGKIINHPNDVGGYLTIATGTACTDTDHDGMPDAWETLHGLNPANAADGAIQK